MWSKKKRNKSVYNPVEHFFACARNMTVQHNIFFLKRCHPPPSFVKRQASERQTLNRIVQYSFESLCYSYFLSRAADSRLRKFYD